MIIARKERPWYQKMLSVGEKKRLQRLARRAEKIGLLEAAVASLTDDQLRAKTQEFVERHDAGESLDKLLEEAFAAVREAGKRSLGMRHFDVQLIGGMVLHEGAVAEMQTGEGKTLVATLALYLNAIGGNNVHLVTTNDYLARRDALWMKPLYAMLGMTVGYLENMQGPESKKSAYSCNITYGTNSEFGFDYLRDNMATHTERIQQRGHRFAIVDEVDSILIDEARTPLIISGQPEAAADTYYQLTRVVERMHEGEHYDLDEKMHIAYPSEAGIALAEKELGLENLYTAQNVQLVNHLNQAIRAKALYHKDKDYIIAPDEEGEMGVMIVDEHTGRVMEGRRWSEGLHQAIEAKEGLAIQEENVTVATVTIQNYFRLYSKLSGMTGTAMTEDKEFKEIYNLDVVAIPVNKPVQRIDQQDLFYTKEKHKYAAIIQEIRHRHDKGQPILVGTIAVEKSEALARELQQAGIAHHVLNAKNHENEAEIIAQAGQKGAVTIATNMAGRGVDIKLSEEVKELGGLFVVGTERHESRRIDNQLRGRSGRQGDPGESRFYLSADDDLMRVFGGPQLASLLERLQAPEGEALELSFLTKRVEGYQKKREEMNFMSRKNVLKFDDVLNIQRQAIYSQRQEIIKGKDLKESLMRWFDKQMEFIVNDSHQTGEFDELERILVSVREIYPTALEAKNIVNQSGDQLIDIFHGELQEYYSVREELISADQMRQLERVVYLQILDEHWRDHLEQMGSLRDGIGLRGLAQKDPVSEYRREGYEMFEQLQVSVDYAFVRMMTHLEFEEKAEGALELPNQSPRTTEPKVGRNELCPCGSGKKYKRCHGQ